MVAFYPHFVSCSENANLRDVVGLYCVDSSFFYYFVLCFFLMLLHSDATTMYLLHSFPLTIYVLPWHHTERNTLFTFNSFCCGCTYCIADSCHDSKSREKKQQLLLLLLFRPFRNIYFLLWSVNNIAFNILWVALKA